MAGRTITQRTALVLVLLLAGACSSGDPKKETAGTSTDDAQGGTAGKAGRADRNGGAARGAPGSATAGGASPSGGQASGVTGTGVGPTAGTPVPQPPAGNAGRKPGWRVLAKAPLKGRHSHTAVWTGREMIVWGGADRVSNLPVYLADGAAYDPVADRWRPVAASPLAARSDHSAAWTGTEMLVWGGDPGTETGYGNNQFVDGAAYDPATDRWRPLPDFPLERRYGARAVWSGSQLVVWGGANAEEGTDPPPLADGAAYDPAADRWTVLPAGPLTGRLSPLAAPTAAGDVLISWGINGKPGQASDSARYDGGWRPVAATPSTDRAWCFDPLGCIGVDTGPKLVFAGEGLTYDETADRWARTAKSPFADPFLDGKATAWTGQRVVVWGGGTYNGELGEAPPAKVADGGAAYDPSADRWEPLPAAPIPGRARTRGVWTGAEFIVWGGESGYDQRIQYADGAAWTPG